jgi:hypothetical protein
MRAGERFPRDCQSEHGGDDGGDDDDNGAT